MTTEIYIMCAIALFSLYMYVLLDGYDLGMGMMLPFSSGDNQRKLILEIVDTAWDANEGWLILFGLALWGGFPGAYATILPANYLYFIFMILGFITRGIALELQSGYLTYNKRWGTIFIAASWLVTICQGLILGEVLSHFADPAPFAQHTITLLCALLVVAVYSVSGMAWQYSKTEDDLAERTADIGTIATLVLLGIVALFCFLYFSHFLKTDTVLRPFSDPMILLPAFAVVFGIYLSITILFRKKKIERFNLPFILCALTILCGVLLVGLYMFPYWMGPDITIKNAASPSASTLRFMIIGILGCMPIVLFYNLYAVYVFRGRSPVK